MISLSQYNPGRTFLMGMVVVAFLAPVTLAFTPFTTTRTVSVSRIAASPTISKSSFSFSSSSSSSSSSLSMAAEFVPDSGEITRNVLIALTLGGGLIPALISANGATFTALSGRKGYLKEGEEPDKNVETYDNFDPNNTFDPTMGDPKNQKFREYVISSGASGPELTNSQFLLSADKIPLVDIISILGRIDDVNSIADWKNLPSTKRGEFTSADPPMWLPRKAFKVLIRKNKFLGWPIDSKTGDYIGGEELKVAEVKRISKQDALIGDAALDAVFDSWSWGASIATPDKVTDTLKIIKPVPGKNEVDLDAFVGAAVRGRSNTTFAALLFVVIQFVVVGTLFIGPFIKTLTGVDVFNT